MDIRKTGMEHGDKAAAVIVVLVSLWSVKGSFTEYRNPKGPSDELQENARNIRDHLGSGKAHGLNVPTYREAVKASKVSYGIRATSLASPPARMVSAVPPFEKKKRGPGPQTVYFEAAWETPSDFKVDADFGRATISWGVGKAVADPKNAAVPLYYQVMRQKKGEEKWEPIGKLDVSGDSVAPVYSFVDDKVGPKETYSYKVQGVATMKRYQQTEGLIVKVRPPSRLLDIKMEKIIEAETEYERPLWFTNFTEAKEVSTPSDVKLFLRQISSMGAKKATLLVAKYDVDNGWQHFLAKEVAVGDLIVGTRSVRKQVGEVIKTVEEEARSDAKLLEIVDATEMEEVEKWVTVADENGQPVKKKVVRKRPRKVNKAKVLDLTLKKEYWVLSVRDAEVPSEGSGAAGGASEAAVGPARSEPSREALVPRARARSGGAGESAEEKRLRIIRENLASVADRQKERERREREMADEERRRRDRGRGEAMEDEERARDRELGPPPADMAPR